MKGLLIAMRKEYVKPVMESEEFVVNEYVAVCTDIWTIAKCTGQANGNCSISESGITVYSISELANLSLYKDNDCTDPFTSTDTYTGQTLYHRHTNGNHKLATTIVYSPRSANAS